MQEADIEFVHQLQALASADQLSSIEGIGEQRRKEINQALREYSSRGRSATDDSQPRWLSTAVAAVFAFVTIGLIIYAFTLDQLKSHQFYLFRILCPITGAIASGAFSGNMRVESGIFGNKYVVAAVGGFAVFLVMFFGLPDVNGIQDRLWQVRLISSGQVIPSECVLSFRVAGKRHVVAIREGVGQVPLPDTTTTIEDIAIEIPCFELPTSNNSMQISIGQPIDILLRPRPSRTNSEPLRADQYPNPRLVISDGVWSETMSKLSGTSESSPSSHQLVYDNTSRQYFNLLLFNYRQHRDGQDPWKCLPFDCCEEYQYSAFTEANGWNALFVRDDDGRVTYLTSVDVYAAQKTYVVVRVVDGKARADVSQM